jgi:plasmid stabilization system protein ParE
MIERVIFASEAEHEVFESYNWYENQLPGLGDDFVRCVLECIDLIQRHPKIFPVAVDEFRHAVVRRFPYEIFYGTTDDTLTIYSVFHCSQNPEKWRKRLRSKKG